MRGRCTWIVASLFAVLLFPPVNAASLQSLTVTESEHLPRLRPDYPIPAEPNQLFYLQRSTNSNTVIYTARFDSGGNLDRRNPVSVYWRRYNTTGERKPLKNIEKLFAYGVNVRPQETGGIYTVSLKPAGDLPLELRQTGAGRAEILVTIGNRTIRLSYVYLTVDDSGTIPKVVGLSLFGFDIQTGRAVTHAMTISGGAIRP